MDKRPCYPGAIPLDLDNLTPQRNTEIALGFLMQAAFGTNAVIDGLAVTQTATPSMAVLVGPGSIIFSTTVDTLPTGFGSLPVDNADPLVKIGINLTATTMGVLTAPGTVGFSQNWLVEAQFIEADGTPVVLPYYNASNPSIPYTGPSNSGATSNTARTNRVQLQWKAGTAAATGTQNTPAPDAGWFGVSIVTVANGQSSILNSNITPYSLAPTVGTKLAVTRKQLTANLNVYVATTGSDTANSGLSLASPFLTLQKAWNYIIGSLDLNGFSVTVNVSSGTYSQGLNAQGSPLGMGTGNTITFAGTGAVVTVGSGNAITVSSGAVISISGFTLSATQAGQSQAGIALLANPNGTISMGANMVFSTCGNTQIFAQGSGAVIYSNNNYSITGSAVCHCLATSADLILTGVTITLTGSPVFSGAFAQANLGGLLQIYGNTFSGSAGSPTPRYSASINGIINTNAAGATYLPGTSAGTVSSQGQYV